MSPFATDEWVPDDKLVEYGATLCEAVQKQLDAWKIVCSGDAAEQGAAQNEYFLGYLMGSSTVLGAAACKETNVKVDAVGRNISRMHDFAISNVFSPDQLDQIKAITSLAFDANSPAFQKGRNDGELDAGFQVRYGIFGKSLFNYLVSLSAQE